MNWLHHWLCRSDRWRKTMEERVPWVLANTDVGQNVLELGPGPGVTTEVLRHRVQHLTALELDHALAGGLQRRLQDSNVDIVTGNAAVMPFPDGQFSGVVSFTMLHHVPSPDLQDRLLREVCRVLRPGGVFAGSDSRQSAFMQLIHIGDTLNPVDPDTFGVRLQAAGFEAFIIEKKREVFRFEARRPRSVAA